MKITKINDTQLKIENHVEGLETLDIFEIIEDVSFNIKFIINKDGLPCLKFHKELFQFEDVHFDNLIACHDVILNKIGV